MKNAGIAFDEIRVALFTDQMEEQLKDYFSDSKVPVLLDGDLAVWDSLAILEYLAEQYPEKMAWPTNFAARAMARSMSAEMHSSFAALRNELPMNCRKFFPGFALSPGVLRDVDRITQLWRSSRQQYGDGGDWLFGSFGIVDAMYAPVVLRFAQYDVPLESIERDYVDMVLSNPHLIEWVNAGKAETEIIAEDEVAV